MRYIHRWISAEDLEEKLEEGYQNDWELHSVTYLGVRSDGYYALLLIWGSK